MARLMCSCGAGLSNSNAPSNNVLYLFAKSDVDSALLSDKNITLYDYETGNEDEFEFWYCPSCKRVSVVENVPNGRVIGRYSVSSICEEMDLQNLIAFYVFGDVDIYNAEENNPYILLSEFIIQHGDANLYYTDASKSKVYKLTQNNRYKTIYIQE